MEKLTENLRFNEMAIIDKHTEMYDWVSSGMNKSLITVQQRHFFVLN